ncbi:MAG: aminotransferase class I/II-fold pyridoxal phosphate-dependent enzyme [Bacteroidetes bacterium]|jgi:threonine-phosphate decarboxylase|nr:aminotransferase class I/II-fold pyridoxal phosphate-dependent enzyme [Bacteroidota bacterium]
MITGHGDDGYRFNYEIKADFSSNVWYDGPSDKLIQYLEHHVQHINHYPQPSADSLVLQIAEKHNLDPGQVLVTNGSIEAFYLIAQVFSEQKSAIVIPGFAEYEDACALHHHALSYLHHNDQLNYKTDADLVWLGNPNNPDGQVVALSRLKMFLTQNPNTVLIVDEAFCELSHAHESAEKLLSDYENLILVRSFTKTFSIPGIRLGYILSSKKLTESIGKYSIPWSVNTLAQQAGYYILHHYEQCKPDLSRLEKETSQFQDQLRQIDALTVIPSTCNFCLIRLKKGSSDELKSYLLTRHGILIRDASNFRGLDKNYVRFALQNQENNDILVKALKEYFIR